MRGYATRVDACGLCIVMTLAERSDEITDLASVCRHPHSNEPPSDILQIDTEGSDDSINYDDGIDEIRIKQSTLDPVTFHQMTS